MPDEKLDIIKVRTYLCPVCYVPYYSLEKAEQCRNQGLIGEGVKINPGLVVRGVFDKKIYSVFFNEFQNYHYRYDEFINFKRGETLEQIRGVELKGYLKRDYLNSIKNRIIILDKPEFMKFKRLLKTDIDLKKFGLNSLFALTHLYRCHELFD